MADTEVDGMHVIYSPPEPRATKPITSKFWRHILPRLAYHNPSIPMTVNRTADKEGPCVLSVHLASPTSSSSETTPAPSSEAEPSLATPDVLTIDMKMKQESEILAQLMEMTGAKQVEPTPEEVELMRDLEEQSVKSERDSVRSKAWRAQWKKEQNMLKAAREGTL
jgi:large subunit ribosomal protein MRP49